MDEAFPVGIKVWYRPSAGTGRHIAGEVAFFNPDLVTPYGIELTTGKLVWTSAERLDAIGREVAAIQADREGE